MNDIQTSFATISEEQLDQLFNDEQVKDVNVDDIELGKSTSRVKVEKNSDESIFKATNTNNIPFIDVSTLDDIDETGKEEDEKDTEEDDKKIEDKKPEEKKPKEKAKADEEIKSSPEVVEVLKNTAKFLIDKGFWKDFEESEEFLASLDEDKYAELAQRQQEALREEIHTETIEKTGEYGKAIISYIENNGNPDEIIDIFKEQKGVEAISIDSEEGQKEIIEKYYTEVVGWSLDKTKKQINRLISDDELEEEAKEVSGRYTEFFKKEVETLQLQQQALHQQEKERQKEFAKTINTKLTERKDLTEKERKLIQDSIFKYDAALEDGTKVNKFYLKFAEMQKNPDDYLDLVNFVMNKEGYNEKVKTKENNKNIDKKWSFIKNNNTINKTTGSRHQDDVRQKKETIQDLDFSSRLNTK